MLRPPWIAASKTSPCPICGRGDGRNDYCIFIPGKVALCRCAPSSVQKGSRFLHKLNTSQSRAAFGSTATASTPARATTPKADAPRRTDLHLLARSFQTACSPQRLQRLSRDLGLSVRALQLLDAGWCDGEPMLNFDGVYRPCFAWSFPMRDASEKIVGLRMRALQPDARTGKVRKYSFTGGTSGLHIPADFGEGGQAGQGGRGCLCEGPTDTAAAIDLGLHGPGSRVFGRTACESEVNLVLEMLKRWRFEQFVILSQRDEAKLINKRRPELGVFYPGQRGAGTLAKLARLYVPDVRVIEPPAGVAGKDWRDALRAGFTAGDVEQLVAAATPRELSVVSQPTIKSRSSREGVRL